MLKPNYHYGVIQRPNYRPERIPEVLQKTSERLQAVQIECLPYEELLQRYDRRTTLFYLDPPYYARKLYHFNFTDEDFRTLAERLRKVKGRFILSLNDVDEVRKIFAKFHVKRIALSYSTPPKGGKGRYGELIISNFG